MSVSKPRSDSMKSTWRTWNHRDWSPIHWGFHLIGAHPKDLNRRIPVFSKTDKVPYVPQWSSQIFVGFYCLLPMLVHQLYLHYMQQAPRPVLIYLIYTAGIHVMNIAIVHSLRRLAHTCGFLDSEAVPERADIPDVGVWKVALSSFKTLHLRMATTTFITSASITEPFDLLKDGHRLATAFVKVGIYCIVLDFWYYLYHRAMHDVSWLWKYHRTHHLSKHPNMLMTGYADPEQEVFDIFIVPLFTYGSMSVLGLPLSFHEWYFCHMYILFGELWGHCGVRIHYSAPNPLHYLLNAFDADLSHEDHDLHHRYGYRHSTNYGKQTRVWDRVFGSCRERIETKEDNVDYNKPVHIPLF